MLDKQISAASMIKDIEMMITQCKSSVAVHLNVEMNKLYWTIGNYIITKLGYENYAEYGKSILQTLANELTQKYGRGYHYSALTRMIKIARVYSDPKMFATLSQTLSWSHFLELATIENQAKRTYYQQMSVENHWSVRELRQQQDKMSYERSLIAANSDDIIIKKLSQMDQTGLQPDMVLKSSYVLDFLGLRGYFSEKDLESAIILQLEKFILELGQGFAFLERQKRISIDSVDYYLDLLFYHRKLNRLVAIDLKLGKFKPEYKGQMELYLKYLKRYEMQPHENPPIGLLLCSEGNTEHIEIMMLDEENIKVAQYLTELPDKQWFIDKLNRSVAIANAMKCQNELK